MPGTYILLHDPYVVEYVPILNSDAKYTVSFHRVTDYYKPAVFEVALMFVLRREVNHYSRLLLIVPTLKTVGEGDELRSVKCLFSAS